MKVLRLSFFNLKKNKKEVLGILFMTMITTMMLSVVLINRDKIDAAFDESFVSSGSKYNSILIKSDKYRDKFREILEDEYPVTNVTEGKMITGYIVDTYTPDGDTVSYNFNFINEKSERSLESFKKLDKLSDEEIAGLAHPIWLPASFQIVKGYEVGGDFTIIKGGKEYAFTIAGFYETGLYSSDGYTYKLVLSDDDYSLFSMVFGSHDAYSYENNALFFDTTGDFDIDEYLDKCNEACSENIRFRTNYLRYDAEKVNETAFLDTFMMMIIFLSLVTLVASLFMIRHKISGDIEDQMQMIGALEALGYKSRDISMAYVYEYLVSGGVGAVLGAIAAIAVTPLVNQMIRKMLGRQVFGAGGFGGVLISIFAVVILIVLFALLKARKVKKYPPVIALRKGIKTHNFKKNIMPLEKSRRSINTVLAMKGFLGSVKSSIGVCICIAIAGTALLFSAMSFDFFKNGHEGLLSMMGADVNAITVATMSGTDIEEIKDEILTLPETRKAFCGHTPEMVSVKDSSDSGMVTIYNDYSDAENINPAKGRCPEHDNEVMIGLRRSRRMNLDIGDSIVLEHDGLEKSYIVSGIIGSMQNGGTVLYLTNEGYERLNIKARESSIQVYPADGVSIGELEDAIRKHFGGTAKDAAGVTSDAESLEEKVKAVAREKIAVMLNQYGVTDVDYAVMVGDELITGNSRNYAIKDISSYEGIIKTQMDPISATSKTFTFIALIFIAMIVAILLAIVTSNDVRRQRQRLGIMKGMGYSSKDLMKQIAIKMLPATVFGTLFATVLGIIINKAFWSSVFGTIAETNIFVIALTDVLLIIFCYIVSYIGAGRIRKISVNELMSE